MAWDIRHNLALVLALALGACAPSEQEVKTAREAIYQTDFPAVWAAVTAEMHKRYEPNKIKVEDPVHGVIVSDWKLVDVLQEDTEGESSVQKNTQASGVRQSIFARMMVKVEAGPPYRISVDVEAAMFRTNLASLQPYVHGQADEPTFVQPRIDKMYVDVYDRLKKVAVKPPAGSAPPPKETIENNVPATQPASAPAAK